MPRVTSRAHPEGAPASGRGFPGRFLCHRGGAVVLLFGLTLIPILGFIGGAIDYANAYRVRAELQNALDAAALAAGREMSMSSTAEAAEDIALDTLQANLGPDFPPGANVNVGIEDGVVTATATLSVDTYVLGVIGFNSFPVGVSSVINIAGGTFEIVMVLDNSGSMAGSKINDLKDAASTLVDILFSSQLSSDHVTIGLVPFAASVNVGPQYANAPWMDQTGESPIHAENFDDPDITRWDMYGALNNASWAGCVEVRPSPHDVTDSAPAGGDSLFVPMFAPDEPDTDNDYINDYLDDDDGSCHWSVSGGSNDERQRRTCKYENEWANTSLAFGSRYGPNHLCDSQPLRTLTSNPGQITDAINAMNAYGGTNIMEGLMWGWRLLSPGEPFTDGLPYEEPDNAKIIILMSDGENFHQGTSTHNQSWYHAYGYHAQGRLGAPSNWTSVLRATMNTRTSQACTNAKAAGIIIYTLALEINDDATEDMLRDCASTPSRFFTLDDSDALDDAFEAIAKEITKLRIAG